MNKPEMKPWCFFGRSRHNRRGPHMALVHHGKAPGDAKKGKEEVDTVLENKRPDFAGVAKLAFLTSVIKETLRLFPPAIGIFAREAKQQLELGGYEIPKGSIVYAFSYVTHRDERWFPDPEHFDPERFLGEKERKISPFAYFPFGAGPRACIGAQFALTEMTLVAACLLRRFEFCLRPGDDNREPLTHLSLRPKGGLSMLVTKRRNSKAWCFANGSAPLVGSYSSRSFY